VPILPSAGRRIQELLRPLESPAAAERESAVARLTLLGPRTIPHLEDFLGRAGPTGRLAAVDVLERLGEARGLGSLLLLTRDRDEAVARRAIEVAAAFPEPRAAEALRAALTSGSPLLRRAAVAALGRLHRVGLVEAVEPLLGVLLDQRGEEDLRLAALEALSSLEGRTLLPALQALTADASPAVVRAARGVMSRRSGTKSAAPREPSAPQEAALPALLTRLEAAHTSSAEVATIVEALVTQRSPALLPLLGRRLEALSARAGDRGDEAAARSKARVHLALGALGSRIALHDLREMLKARPLYAALDLFAAVDLVGDASLVPALAALAAEEPRLAEATTVAFRSVARREKLRRTSRVVKALPPTHREALERLWPPPQRATSVGASRDRNRKLR
jgi:HEAT repeat protein